MIFVVCYSFAARLGTPRLIMTHFSQRYQGDPGLRSVLAMERVEEEARSDLLFSSESRFVLRSDSVSTGFTALYRRANTKA